MWSFLWLVGMVALLLIVVTMTEAAVAAADEQEQQQQEQQDNIAACEVDGGDDNDETCRTAMTPPKEFPIHVSNKSPFRADIYWDNGKHGVWIATVETGDHVALNTFREHRFFVTRHGVKERLFDPTTDEPLWLTAKTPDQTLDIPASAAPSTNLCQDRFSVCQEYVKDGGCWNGPGWMIVHCCKSCDKDLNASHLIDSKIRCTKEHLNITEPIWKPGDLNKLFTSWAIDDDNRFAIYEPNILSSPDGAYGGASGPWVMTFDNFMSSNEAEALIRGGAMVGFERSTNQGNVNRLGEMERVVSTTRTSSNAWCTGPCEALPEIQALTERIEQVTGVPRKNYESFQILEYSPNQFYRQHHDSTGKDPTPSGNRILTFFLYLSDVEEGGETYFNKLDLAVKPKKGRALVWPSVKDDEPDFWDNRMYHEARDVIKGKKYAANHWIHLNDYEGPNQWGCTGSFS